VPRLWGAFSLKYLLLGVGAANVCAICFIFSLSMAEDATQTMQVGMLKLPCLKTEDSL